MGITIRVQNFQSIRDQTLEVDGFTAITGPNNVGKSAFLRAVKGLLCNARGTSFVRRGETHCTVSVTFGDGTTICWEKGFKGINRYRLNDEPWIEKVGHGVPEVIQKQLGVLPVKAGTEVLWPQIGDQFDGQVFLLNKPGSVTAEAISDAKRVGHLNRALKRAESERRKVKSTLKLRRDDQVLIAEQLRGFDGLSETSDVIDTLDTQWKRLRGQRDTLEEMVRYQKALARERGLIEALEGVEEIQIPGKKVEGGVREAQRKLSALRRLRTQRNSLLAEVQRLEEASAAFEAVELGSEGQDEVDKLQKVLRSVTGMQRDLQKSQGEVERLGGEIAQTEENLCLAEEEIQSLREELGTCPLCGASLQDDSHSEH